MELTQLRPGLYRWTAPHPDYEPDPEPDSPSDWPEKVGCVAYQAPEALVLIDPLVPQELWPALDRLAEGRRVAVLTTIGFHRRSRDAVAERYGASTSRARKTLPEGVETIKIPRAGETMIWIPEHEALVPGDRILGGREDGLRLPGFMAGLPDERDHRLRAPSGAPSAPSAADRARAGLTRRACPERRPRRP